jgi:hypothetical protein
VTTFDGVIFFPVSLIWGAVLFVVGVTDEKFDNEATVVDCGWVMIEGGGKINLDQLPFAV